MKFIIKDWCGNIMNHKGIMERPEYAVPMVFKNGTDAWEYLYEVFSLLDDEDLNATLGEYYIDGLN